MRALLTLTLLAGGAIAQPAFRGRISGVVAEPGIAGAPVATPR